MPGSGAKWWKVGNQPGAVRSPAAPSTRALPDVREQGSVFTGEYRHAVDDKGRLAVPSRFRAQLSGNVVVARWLDTCLAIFPMAAWDELATKVGSLPMTDPNARLLQRQLFAGAFETELDRQGRVLVPAHLRTFAGLETEALVLGARDHAEIWAPARWEDYSRALEGDAFTDAVAGLGI
jgi:MraZ protein